MNTDELQYAAHQLGMVRAGRAQAYDDWRAHQRAAAALRPMIGPVYQCYPYPNKALVKALASSLREHLISRAEFAACLPNVMEKHEMHLLTPDPALEELRRQLRDGEITYVQYKAALRTLPEPGERMCQRERCNRPALVVEDGVALCGVCQRLEARHVG
jgi:hypothetical protein